MEKNWSKIIGIIVLVVIVSFITVKLVGSSTTSSNQDSVASKVLSSGEIRIGYIMYSPFLYKDETTGKLTGLSYDIVEAAAKNLGLKTNWVEEAGWGTAFEGLTAKRYDILGTQIWPNSARAREGVFSIAPFSSVLYPYVKAGDTRFSADLSKLNSDKVTIVTTDGDIAVSIANTDYPLAKLSTLPQMSSTAETLLNITSGKADVTFLEPAAVALYSKSNPGKIDRANNTPVRMFGDVFGFARGEESMASMWNVALGELQNDGTITRILAKYNVSGYYTLNK